MKFVLALIAVVVVLAAVCHEGDASIIINGPQEQRDFAYPPQGDCTCENCACRSRFACANDNIVPYRYCPGSYIYVCCKTGPPQ